MADEREEQLSLVPEMATQDREVRARWAWTEPAVWTNRMLTALERGVKGGKWFSLIDKVFAPKNLRASWEKVRRNRGTAGVDHQTVQKFETAVDRHLGDLHVRLKEDRYVPQPALRRWIPKPGTQKMRPLGIPTIKDRVVQGAVRKVLERVWEEKLVDESYGFRPGRSCSVALRRVQILLRA
jgi:RNA-directed DNA polymerase